MPTIAPTPLIIQGPAIVTFNGLSIYTKSPISVQRKVETFDVKTDFHGAISKRLASQMFEISFTPAGQLVDGTTLGKYLPYISANVGVSIFGATNTPLVIVTLAGTTHTFARAGVSKLPGLKLTSKDTLFKDMSFSAIGNAAVAQNGAHFFNTVASAAFGDTSFDGAQLKTAQWSAAWGSTFTGLGSVDGFDIDFPIEIDDIKIDGYGVADRIFKSISATCKFAPSTLTQAQLELLLAYQDTGAVLVGQDMAVAGNDLVITSDPLVVTLNKMGPADAEQKFATGVHRHGDVMFVNKRTWTSGAANPLATFTVN